MTPLAILCWYTLAALAWHRYVFAPQVHADGLTRFGARMFAALWLPMVACFCALAAIELLDRLARRRRR